MKGHNIKNINKKELNLICKTGKKAGKYNHFFPLAVTKAKIIEHANTYYMYM